MKLSLRTKQKTHETPQAQTGPHKRERWTEDFTDALNAFCSYSNTYLAEQSNPKSQKPCSCVPLPQYIFRKCDCEDCMDVAKYQVTVPGVAEPFFFCIYHYNPQSSQH